MTFFSATAPRFTDEDSRREREGLSDEEKQQLYRDMHGISDDASIAIEGNPAFIRKSLNLLDEAIDSLSHEVKASYVMARDRVPELVQEESPPLAFLRCESFDPWAAAKRLCGYWTLRTLLFGPDRAFLPMTLDGAMEQDYDLVLSNGLVFQIDDDMHGRVVIFWDRMRMSNVRREVALRCAMYVTTKLVSRSDFCSKGYVVLSNFQNCDLRKHYDRALTKLMIALLGSIPAKLKAQHLCTGPGRSVAGMLLPVLRTISGPYFRLRQAIHAGSGSDVLPRFKDYGLTEKHVQVMYGPFPDRLAVAQNWFWQQQQKERQERFER